jgi:P-type Ca2+ transporter type 2C
MDIYAKTTDAAAKDLDVDSALGLSTTEADRRLAEHGSNSLVEKKKTPLFVRFLMQFKDVMVIILLIAALISLFTGEKGFGFNSEGAVDAAIIFFVVLMNAVLGLVQESRAEKALDALKRMTAPNAKVLRDGIRKVIPASTLVPGDIILVEAGDLVPADSRIITCANLKAEESSLTGESVPVDKSAEAILGADVAIGDRKNMLFTSGTITYGRGTAVVTATGMDTEVGKIATMLNADRESDTPLQIKLAKIGKYLGIMALGICALIFVLGLLEGKPPFLMFMTSVSLAVAAIPEGLPAVVTIVLAIGVSRLVKQNAIIRKLPAVETLGCASVICSDKTGTLTQNRMTVVKCFTDSLQDFSGSADGKASELLQYASLCCDGTVTLENGTEKHVGDPTETALVAAAMKAGYDKAALEADMPRVAELPFDSDRKMMTTVHKTAEGYLSITKGAPDIILSRCLANHDQDGAQSANAEMGRAALRVLAVAVKRFQSLPVDLNGSVLEEGLDFTGLIGMIDPPREEVKQAVALCKAAGIRAVMITGDHVETAVAIAKALNIYRPGDRAITGAELAHMGDEELLKNVRSYSVYARVAPEHKVRIVSAWQKAGEVVAMTGDGVNDAPALKTADIGCAMGITGTDVTKGAADMVLTDDNFATIVVAVREGRGIYSNILRAIQFLLSTNLSEIFVILASIVMRWASPLSAVHLLWINLVTDSLPALALGVEPVDPGVMSEKPRRKDESIFANGFATSIALQGLMIGILTISAFIIGRLMTGIALADFHAKQDAGMTMAFMVLASAELFHAFNLKSRFSLFKKGFFTNKYLNGAFAICILMQVAVALIPFTREIFSLYNMSLEMWGIVIGLSAMPIVIMEIVKLFKNMGRKEEA